MKRFISMMLALIMCIGAVPHIFALSVGETEVEIPEEPAVTVSEDAVAGEDYTENVVLFALKSADYLAIHEDTLAKIGVKDATPLFTEDGEAASFGSKSHVWYRATVSGEVTDAISTLVALDGVVYAEPEYIYETEDYGEPSATEISCNWSYDRLHKHGGKHWWKDTLNMDINPGYGTIVAVIDTGVDYTHEDLASNMWVNTAELYGVEGVDDDANGYIDDVYGVNVTATGAMAGNPMDDHGHGTHVAGIIGMTANDIGGVGIAYGTKIMAIKAGYSTGSFSSTAIAKAINYAHMMGADVINMSFGGPSKSYLVENALESAFSDCVLVAAAGNDGLPTTDAPTPPYTQKVDIYPAGYSYVIGVMASDDGGRLAKFSNWDYIPNANCEYEMTAPGVEIYSALPGDRYASWNGTSMATPHVAAAAAIIRSYYPDKDMYSSRFIMGQLASATEDTCAGYPALNIFDSINNLPKPNITVKDSFLMDNVGEGEFNDGDAIIDAGETVDLGVLIRNQWGLTGEITVKVDTISEGGVANPFIEFITDEITLQPAGTFAEVNNGWVYNDSYLESVSDPIRFIVSPDTPNDTEICLNITVTTTNGFDEDDDTIYTALDPVTLEIPTYTFRVQTGQGIKGAISEDMTLTNDYLWIVENSILIEEGVTVTVEPGTKIQFYSSDYEGAYGGLTIPYIDNEGTLLMLGTEEEPIEIFPCAGYEEYAVEIFGEGYEKLQYCHIINARLGHYGSGNAGGMVDIVDHCILTQNPATLRTRYFGNAGAVYNSTARHTLNVYSIKNSQIYGMRIERGTAWYYAHIIENCLFNNCRIEDQTNNRDNVSRRNNTYLAGDVGIAPEYEDNSDVAYYFPIFKVVTPRIYEDFFSYETAESKYLIVSNDNYFDQFPSYYYYRAMALSIGGDLTVINDDSEYNFINASTRFNPEIGYKYNYLERKWEWVDGTTYALNVNGDANIYDCFARLASQFDGNNFGSTSSVTSMILEFPKTISDEQIIEGIYNFNYEEWAKEYSKIWVSNNAFLNPVLNNNPDSWTTLVANEYNSEYFPNYATNNYWGTENEMLINKMIVDADDFAGTYQDIIHEPILTLESESLADIYPFVTKVYLTDSDGNIVANVTPGEEYDVHVLFNRDMDTDTQPTVTYGPATPYTDYSVQGEFVSAREWVGKTKISPVLTSGTMFFRTKGGVAADDKWLECGEDILRFSFNVSTTGALAMMLNADGGANKVELSWAQNDYEVLAGYNIYRSTSADGPFEKINLYLVTENDYVDTNVEPGVTYYYYFKVVNTDGNEEENMSNIASAAPIDNIPPMIQHTPVESAKAGTSVTISASASDNIAVERVTLYYRVAGSANFKSKNMTKNADGDRYVAVIPAGDVTAAGVEYYVVVEDSDGNLNRSGTENVPHKIRVNSAPYISGITPSKLSIEGGRTVTILGGNFSDGITLKIGGKTVDKLSVIDSGTITFVSPAMASGTYAVVITDLEGRTATSPNPISYIDESSACEIPTNLTITSDVETVIPLYVTSASDIISLHAEIELPEEDFISCTAELADPDSNAILDCYRNGNKLVIGCIGSSDIAPEDGPIINIIVVASVADEKQCEITLHDVSFNGVEVTTVISSVATLKPSFRITADVVYYSDPSVKVGGVNITADGVTAATAEDGTALITVNKKTVTVSASSTGTDHAVTAFDASLVLQTAVGKIALDEYQALAADVDGNGKVNEYDAALILQKAVRKIDMFPIGTAWIFAPASVEMTLYSGENTVTFVAISVGDVDGSYRGE